MRGAFKVFIVALVLCLLMGQAFAFLPSERGVSAPRTVWSDRNIHGTVSGKVVTSADQAKGIEGAYVALVDAMHNGREYANTTTDAGGNYRFTDVNATYSSVLYKGSDGTGGTYQQGMNTYMVYANGSGVEGYSGTFGIDTNHTNTIVDKIVLYTGAPEVIATPEPTGGPEPTAAPTEAPAPPTATPTPTPASLLPTGLLLGAIAIIILAIAAIAAFFLYMKKRPKQKKK